MRALVFLHGHDDDARTWAAAAEAMAPDGWAVVRPTGPRPTTGGASWFDSDDAGLPRPADVEEALAAVDGHLRAAAAAHGAGPGELVLAGFSQGAALVLLHALRPPGPGAVPLAGAVVVSGWLPDVEGLEPSIGAPGGPPLLVAHGTDDEVVPLPLGRGAARLLERHGHDVTLVERPVGHDPAPFAGAVREWLATRSAPR